MIDYYTDNIYQRRVGFIVQLIINNEKYFLTSQWYDKNKEKVIDFIKAYNHLIDN